MTATDTNKIAGTVMVMLKVHRSHAWLIRDGGDVGGGGGVHMSSSFLGSEPPELEMLRRLGTLHACVN